LKQIIVEKGAKCQVFFGFVCGVASIVGDDCEVFDCIDEWFPKEKVRSAYYGPKYSLCGIALVDVLLWMEEDTSGRLKAYIIDNWDQLFRSEVS